ncbi:MAG: hypothetical protein M1339_03735, partial [Bacteroidetes bacterium]|nr:hypothetical protein [Bacteroidota bacterium]
DTECPHLAYLSIYDEAQKERIRENSRTRLEMTNLLTEAGFLDVKTIPFAMLPETVVYDLGIEQMMSSDLAIAVQADLAARALFPDRHGEMFLAIGKNEGKRGV